MKIAFSLRKQKIWNFFGFVDGTSHAQRQDGARTIAGQRRGVLLNLFCKE